uniref:Uncharacterized protein n=1 Tax=Arundo donax TaxID=35708 RepID=A0A0A9DR00_ARUDO
MTTRCGPAQGSPKGRRALQAWKKEGEVLSWVGDVGVWSREEGCEVESLCVVLIGVRWATPRRCGNRKRDTARRASRGKARAVGTRRRGSVRVARLVDAYLAEVALEAGLRLAEYVFMRGAGVRLRGRRLHAMSAVSARCSTKCLTKAVYLFDLCGLHSVITHSCFYEAGRQR